MYEDVNDPHSHVKTPQRQDTLTLTHTHEAAVRFSP